MKPYSMHWALFNMNNLRPVQYLSYLKSIDPTAVFSLIEIWYPFLLNFGMLLFISCNCKEKKKNPTQLLYNTYVQKLKMSMSISELNFNTLITMIIHQFTDSVTWCKVN